MKYYVNFVLDEKIHLVVKKCNIENFVRWRQIHFILVLLIYKWNIAEKFVPTYLDNGSVPVLLFMKINTSLF